MRCRVVMLAVLVSCRPVPASVADVDLTAELQRVIGSVSGTVQRNRHVGNTAERSRGRVHDTYDVALMVADTQIVRTLAFTAAEGLRRAGWDAPESGSGRRTRDSVVDYAEHHFILRSGSRDGSLHVWWNGRDTAATVSILVDLAGVSETK